VQTIRGKRHKYLIKAMIAAREKAGIKQADLARHFRQYQSWAARLESGERRIDVVEFLALADAIGFDPIEMLKEIMAVEPDKITGPGPPARR
jgi:transcriptional regulator with XRE-family HTH domain